MDSRKRAGILSGCLMVLFVLVGLSGCGVSKPTPASSSSTAAQQTVAAILTQTAAAAQNQTPTPTSTQNKPASTPLAPPAVEKSGGVMQEPARNVVVEKPSGKTTMEAYHAPTIEPTKK